MIPAEQAGLVPGAPGLRRRLACFVYEGILLFGVVMTTGLLYGWLTEQRHALVGTQGLRAVLFVVIGAYFVWFWSRGGQTLAMKTWRIRVVTASNQPLTMTRALCRYLASWLWFLPALVGVGIAGLKGSVPLAASLLAGVLLYGLLAWLHPSRQYPHDVLCGTRLIHWDGPARTR